MSVNSAPVYDEIKFYPSASGTVYDVSGDASTERKTSILQKSFYYSDQIGQTAHGSRIAFIPLTPPSEDYYRAGIIYVSESPVYNINTSYTTQVHQMAFSWTGKLPNNLNQYQNLTGDFGNFTVATHQVQSNPPTQGININPPRLALYSTNQGVVDLVINGNYPVSTVIKGTYLLL